MMVFLVCVCLYPEEKPFTVLTEFIRCVRLKVTGRVLILNASAGNLEITVTDRFWRFV